MKRIILLITLAMSMLLITPTTSAQITAVKGQYAHNEMQDLALVYMGATWRNKWTVDDFKPLVAHTFTDGHTDWFFPGFLFLELDYNTKTLCPGFGKVNPTKDDWQSYINQHFSATRGFAALDACIEEYKSQIGAPPFKHKIVMCIPSPLKNDTQWGKVNGKKLDFSKSEDRFAAVKWYIDEFINQFRNKHYKNIELEGFYWLDESTGNARNVIISTSTYLHRAGMRFYWIPFFTAAGRFEWKELGFDIAYLQPNYFFHPNKVSKDRLAEACKLARENGMGLEFEMDQRHLEMREKFAHRAADYFDAFDANGVFENSAIAYYFQGKTINLLAASTVSEDKDLLERWASRVAKRNKKTHQVSYNSNTTSGTNNPSSQTGNTPPGLKTGTRKLNPEDWHF